MDHCVPSHKTPSRSWADIRGEVSVLVLLAVSIAHGVMAYESIQVHRVDVQTTHRLIQRLDSDALAIEVALAKLEGREPSEKARKWNESQLKSPSQSSSRPPFVPESLLQESIEQFSPQSR